MKIFEALGELDGSNTTYEIVKVWEITLMLQLGLTPDEYTDKYDTKQRAILIANNLLPKYTEMLESDLIRKQMDKNSG